MAKLELGLIVGVTRDPNESFKEVADVGVPTCQLVASADAVLAGEHPDPKEIRAAADAAGIRITSVFLQWNGQMFNNVDGPGSMGLVPPDLRAGRVASGKAFSDWVREMGVDSITCHIGFIPDDELDPLYAGFIEAMRDLAVHCANNDQIFCFETGQELASTLKRTIRDVDTGNLFVNLDPANLILYGKSDPLDAVEIFGEYVRGMHAKDGVWPNRDHRRSICSPSRLPSGSARSRHDRLAARTPFCEANAAISARSRVLPAPHSASTISSGVSIGPRESDSRRSLHKLKTSSRPQSGAESR